MIIRVHGSDRNMRLEAGPDTRVADLKEEIKRRTGCECTALSLSGREMNDGLLSDYGVQNGSMLQAVYVVAQKDTDYAEFQTHKKAKPGLTQNERPEHSQASQHEQPEDRLACTHGSAGMCANCAPKDSWLSETFANRRFVSQGAYEEYLESQGRVLEMRSHLPPVCSTHPKKGRCHKCMPEEITLTRQPFRAVDHVEIYDKNMIKYLLTHYRETQTQYVALLIGRYADYTEVSKGTRAEVHTILPVLQKGYTDGFTIDARDRALSGKDESLARALRLLDMEVVGMVYTRLGEKTLPFISCMEIELMARMQNAFPYTSGGVRKGSRFVSLVISGTGKGAEILEFMATVLAMELVSDGIMRASKNPQELVVHPVIARWSENGDRKESHAVPLEYFVVRPTHGVKAGGGGVFYTKEDEAARFWRGQDLSALKKHFQRRMGEEASGQLALKALSDFQVLLELLDRGLVPDKLLQIVAAQDTEAFGKYIHAEEAKGLLDVTKDCKLLLSWQCSVCTLENIPSALSCDACGMPKEE